MALLLAAIAASIAAAVAGQAAVAPRVLVVSSDDTPPLRAALVGVREALGATPIEEIAPDGNFNARIEAAARDGSDVAVIALGGHAAARAAREAPAIATIDCMSAQAAPGALTVPLDMPADQQILWLRRLLPGARYIGILYDPAQNAERVDSLAAALRRADFNPVLAPVQAPAMLAVALGRLHGAVDALLGVPDATVYTPQTTKGLLLFSFRHKLPLIGPSEAWVKAGALYALVWDYREVGAFCAQLALRALPGGGAAAAPTPPRPRVVVNERAAELFRLRWDASLRRAFDPVLE
ncbi:MAG: ABC transporter substrate binding protein [Casimicrobiaceae bacterium]